MSKRPSIMRSLGQFFGHVIQGAKSDVRKPEDKQRVELKREVEEATRDAPPELGGGKMTVRRTTIEEIEVEEKSTGQAKKE